MNEIPQADGTARFELSDTGYAEKLLAREKGQPVDPGKTYYDQEGGFYHDDYLKS